MTVTVLLCVYNASDFLPGALQSVFDQTYEDWELLILNDGSTEPAVHDVLHGLAPDPRVHQHHFHPTLADRRASCRYARNINWGFARSSGRYVTYLAGDDRYMPDRLDRMVAKLSEGHDVVYGPQELVDPAGARLGVRGTVGVLDDAFHIVDLNSVTHTRESFTAAGGWPTEPTPENWRQADAHMWRRLTGAGYRFVPVDGDGPTDVKHYRDDSVDARVIRGEDPW